MNKDMSDLNRARVDTWTPPERPEWVARINEEGSYMDIESVVPLDENSLINSAKTSTGLSDFGAEDWHEPFQVLIKSLKEDANLNLMGRIRTRSELIIFLQARLRIEDTYKKHPEIDEEEIIEPMIILGQGRSGTSALINLLSAHPENGVIKTWEAMLPCPPPEKETYLTDPRIEQGDKLIQQWNRVTPTLEAIHEFNGEIPTECIQLMAINFTSPAWLNSLGPIPGYNAYMHGRSMVPGIQYHKRILKLLQWKNPRKRWVLKSPNDIDYFPDVVEVYPDAKFIWPHRDPVKALASGVGLIGTIQWGRTDHPFAGGSFDYVMQAEPASQRLNQAIDWLEGGLLAENQLCNVLYQDFIKDQIATIKKIYETFEIPLSDEGLAALDKYVADNPRSHRPAHKYSIGSGDQVQYERDAFKRYQEYFNVPSET